MVLKVNNYKINFIKNTNFNSKILSICFFREAKQSELVYMNLLRNYLIKANNIFQTEEEMEIETLKLYGASPMITISQIGTKLCFEFTINYINPKKIANDYEEDVIKLFFNTILNPLIIDNQFKKEFIETEKEKLKLSIKQKFLNIDSYLNYDILKYISNSESVNLNIMAVTEKEINDVNEKNLYEFYKKIIFESYFECFAFGDFTSRYLKNTFKKYFNITNSQNFDYKYDEIEKVTRKKVVDHNAKIKFEQAVLTIVYKVKDYTLEDSLKLMILKNLLSSSVSLLLYNELREKQNICYSTYASVSQLKGMLKIDVYTSPENKNKAISGIDKVIHYLQNKDLTLILQKIKKQYKFSEQRQLDNKFSIFNKKYCEIMKMNKTEKEIWNELKNITSKDMNDFAKRLKKAVEYFLKGEKDE